MILLDVNVLVHAHREDAPHHHELLPWLEGVLNKPQPFALSGLVLSGFLRVVTHPRVFDPPSPLAPALEFAQQLRDRPNCVLLEPGPRHWELFTDLCMRSGAKGNLVPDAFFAALAIESGSEWVSTDRDFARFPGLSWRNPLDGG